MNDSDENIVLHHSSDSSSDSDEYEPPTRRPRIFRQRINFNIFEFKERFRLTEEQVDGLVNRIGHYLRHDTLLYAMVPYQKGSKYF